MDNLSGYLEALIFASEQSIRIEELQYCLQTAFGEDFEIQLIEKELTTIRSKFLGDNFSIELVKTGNGYQFLTKKLYHPIINQLQLQRSKKKLSQAAIETLAIIAYRQPVTRTDIEEIRGVNCDYTIQKLLEKELITISGKSDSAGKPLLYNTSPLFMDYFGINNMEELPQSKDMARAKDTIGEETE